jgi:hypothetical protein
MTRKLRPCGTRSAYQRHLYHKEDPCDACKAANSAKNSDSAAAMSAYEADMAAALAADEPVIIWEFDPRTKVQVAVYIDDPHAEQKPKPHKPKGLRAIDIEYLEDIS